MGDLTHLVEYKGSMRNLLCAVASFGRIFATQTKERLVLASGITEGHKVKSAMYTNLKL